MYRTSWSGLFVIRSATGMTKLHSRPACDFHMSQFKKWRISICISHSATSQVLRSQMKSSTQKPRMGRWAAWSGLSHTSEGIRHDYAATAKLWLVRHTEETCRETCSRTTSFATNLTWSHLGLNLLPDGSVRNEGLLASSLAETVCVIYAVESKLQNSTNTAESTRHHGNPLPETQLSLMFSIIPLLPSCLIV